MNNQDPNYDDRDKYVYQPCDICGTIFGCWESDLHNDYAMICPGCESDDRLIDE